MMMMMMMMIYRRSVVLVVRADGCDYDPGPFASAGIPVEAVGEDAGAGDEVERWWGAVWFPLPVARSPWVRCGALQFWPTGERGPTLQPVHRQTYICRRGRVRVRWS